MVMSDGKQQQRQFYKVMLWLNRQKLVLLRGGKYLLQGIETFAQKIQDYQHGANSRVFPEYLLEQLRVGGGTSGVKAACRRNYIDELKGQLHKPPKILWEEIKVSRLMRLPRKVGLQFKTFCEQRVWVKEWSGWGSCAAAAAAKWLNDYRLGGGAAGNAK
jgi:hypothetical protein